MDNTTLIIVVVVVCVAAGLAVYWVGKQRSVKLRQKFGPEYDHTLERTGDRRRAESELQARAERVGRLNIRPLAPAEASRFGEQWRVIQARFVDDPPLAVAEANDLLKELMEVRGYPVGDFEQRVADVSVDHPHVVQNYRIARDLAARSRRGEATTEDLRRALMHYRMLFEDLLETPEPAGVRS
jgi:hypothetical protein